MENTNNVPRLRFPRFTDAWEQREFGNIAQRLSETAVSCDELPYIEYEDVISNQGILNKDVSAKEGKKTGIIFSEENVLYGKLRPYLHNWLNPDFKGVAVGDWWVLKPINADKNFLYRLIQSDNFDNVANQSTGTKMPRADWKLVSATEFCLPKSLEEQAKIGHYFTDLDNLITLHQRRCDKLEEYKKAMLQKIFSQELRFKREDGTDYPEWELIAFGNLYQRNNERNGNQFKTEKTISVATMKYNGKGNGADKNSLSTYKVLRLGDIAFEGHENKEFSHGRFVLNDIGDGIMSPRFSCLRPVKELVNGFWKYYIHYEPVMYSILLRSTKKGTMMHELVYDDFYKQSILVPKVEEQQKIADFLSALDEAINYAKQELDKWKELKKGLLQQMFV